MIKSKGYKLILLFLLQLCFGTSVAFGQGNLLYYNKVDTLSFGHRFNLKTNLVDWATLTPNIGIEFAIGNKNWNKWTIGAHGRGNWNTNSKENAYYVYDILGARLEVRKYFHAPMPKRVFYLGGYVGANQFDLKFGPTGNKGQAFVGGVSVGTVTQLYGYQNGSSLDLDLGLNAGVVFAKYHEYHRDFVSNKYVYTIVKPEGGYNITFSPWIYAASTDILRASLIYHFGTKLSNRYKDRLKIDNDYRIALEAAKLRRDSLNIVWEKERRLRNDSLEKVDYEKRFEEQHLELEKKYERDSLSKVNAALRVEGLKAKEEAKRMADSLKVADREKAIEEKANAKRVADSLRIVHRNEAQEAQLQKEKAKEETRRIKDSLRQANELKKQEAIKAKEEQKELKQQQKAQGSEKKDAEKSETQVPVTTETTSSGENNSEVGKSDDASTSNDNGAGTEKTEGNKPISSTEQKKSVETSPTGDNPTQSNKSEKKDKTPEGSNTEQSKSDKSSSTDNHSSTQREASKSSNDSAISTVEQSKSNDVVGENKE